MIGLRSLLVPLENIVFKSSYKDTINCPEKVMKISHLNQTNQGILSILR